MANIARGAKTGGGTDFNVGQSMKSAEFNTDFNVIVTEINGNLDNTNIDAAAAIAYSKLDLTGLIVDDDMTTGTLLNRSVNANADIALTKLADISGAASDAATATDPGVSNSESLATTGAGELERLRYAIERLALGIDAGRFDATGTIEATYWGDLPARGLQRIPGINGVVTSGLPSGWSNVSTATLAQEAADAADGLAGKGRAIKITAAGSANEGMSYTLSGLKESTRYWFGALMKATSGDTAKFTVTGADATSAFRDLTVTSTSTTWTWLTGVIQTDATPTNIVVSCLAAADTDVVWVADVRYGECSAQPLNGGQRVAVVGYLAGSTAGTQTIDGGSDAGVDAGYRIIESGTTDFDVTIYVPGDGYYVEAEARVSLGDTASDTTAQDVMVKLYRSVNGAALSAVDTTILSREGTSSGNIQHYTGVVGDVVLTPVPGQSYRYLIAATQDDHTVTAQKAHASLGATTTWLKVRAVPYGG